MLVELISIKRISNNDFRLEKVYLNPKHIVYLTEDRTYKQALMENKINLDLNKNVDFTKIRMTDNALITELTVVGAPSDIESKMSKRQKILLRD